MSVTKLKEDILPAVFSQSGCLFVDCEFDSKSVGQDQNMSNVVFLSAVLQKSNAKVKLPLVIKFEPSSAKLRKCFKTSIQFHNEVLMYKQVLPLLDKFNICGETFAQFYHGVGESDGFDNVVIIEDLRSSGYQLSQDRAFISFDHLTLALAKLGRFHALSYAAKKEFPTEFSQLVNNLKETTWEDIWDTYHAVVKASLRRPADYLIQQGKHIQLLQKLLESFDSNVKEFMKKIVAPEEPLAVVCHGDFCRNNVLFKYDPKSKNPKDVKFFDVATARYSTPVVDISFFLFLNSSKKTRQDHWDDLVSTYHHSLSTTVPGLVVPSLEDIQKEMQKKALYGFVLCSFFLPSMLYGEPNTGLEAILDSPPEEVAQSIALLGGQEGTELLASMLEELIDRGCLTFQHEFIN